MSSGTVDIIIVGAGLSGAVTAAELSGHGLNIVCLEQGTWPDYGSHGVHGLEFDPAAEQRWPRNPEDRNSSADYPINADSSPIDPLMWNGVGGGTVLYLSKWHRMLPSDFRVRTLDGVAYDWPYDYNELEPYYTEVEQQFNISGQGGDPAYPPGGSPPNPPLPLRKFGHMMAETMNSLGWGWWPGASAVFEPTLAHQLPYGSHKPKDGRAVKSSVDITHWPGAIRGGVELKTGTQVRRLLMRGNRAQGVEYVDADGRVRQLSAEQIILCANGIGTPRLLLASADENFPTGIANRSSLVGRNLMVHPLSAISGVFESDVEGAASPLGAQLQSTHFYETDESRGFVRGAKWGLQPAGGPATVTQSYPWTIEGSGLWGRNFHDNLEPRLGRSAMWSIVSEDLPHPENCVELDWARRDRAGTPGVRIKYSLDENSRRLLEFHNRHAEKALRAAGAVRTFVDPLVRASGWHLMGTTRMGEDPTDSVTDPFGRTHDVDNLHIFDSSTWPTSSGFNPVATQAATALRSAQHLLKEGSW